MSVDRVSDAAEIRGLPLTPREHSLFPLAWFLFGALMVGALSFCYLLEEHRVPRLGLTAWFLVWLAWIPLRRGLSATVARWPIERDKWRSRIPAYLLGGVVIVALLLILRVLVDRFFHTLNGSEFMGFKLRAFLIQSVVYDIFVYVSFLAVGHASSYYRRYTERRVRAATLEARMAEIQLGFLKAQLQPHFLLNSLNLISGQLYEDVEKADAMIADLGGLLRATLESPHQQEVPLERELELLELYLDIARTRFGPRIRVEKRIEPRSLDAMVPSLLLQPLVENVIRHGLVGSDRVSRIQIAASRDAYHLRLTVADNGPGLSQVRLSAPKEGIGLANTRQRLQQLYGGDHQFILLNRPAGGAAATVEIPFRPAAVQELLAKREAIVDHSHFDRRRRTASA